MEGVEFKKASAKLSDYIVNYQNNIRERRVLSNVEPGFLKTLLPEHLPDEPEQFSEILEDVEKFIMPGVTHWSSPKFHAFYPAGNSYPSILADMLSGAMGCIGFTWIASPSCTELEVIMMDWLGELIGLPKEFLAKNGTDGGGVIQVIPSLGTTYSCSFDNIREIGEVCNEFNLWCHVDAAYAGAAFVCEEYQQLMDGVELVDSFSFNTHKWMLVNIDCSALWLKNSKDLVNICNADLIICRHEHEGKVPDYMHWQIPMGRRFRALKLWFVMRIYGKSGIQKHIRNQIALAKEFENYVRKDERFEIFGEVILGLVCFRLKGSNELNKKFLEVINGGGSIYLVPGEVKEVYFLRFAVCSRYTESSDVLFSWNEIQKMATCLLKSD